MQTGAFAAHLASLVPVLWKNKGRYATQDGVMRWTWIKAGVTLAGAGVTLYSSILGKKVEALAEEGAEGATEPSASASPELQAAQQQRRILQWIIPAFAGVVIILGAKHGEMQRPENVELGLLKSLPLVGSMARR